MELLPATIYVWTYARQSIHSSICDDKGHAQFVETLGVLLYSGQIPFAGRPLALALPM